MKVLTEGKTKRVIPVVMLQAKDSITAGDGERSAVLRDKAILATATTCNVFDFLKAEGIPTAYLGRFGETAFIAEMLDMLPLEWIVRRIATGSYLKRNPAVDEGYRFDSLVTEVFLKDDDRGDPIIAYDEPLGAYFLHDSHQPVSDGSMLEKFDPAIRPNWDMVEFRGHESMLKQMSAVIFEKLESAMADQGITLVDMKVEFGQTASKAIKLGDVIDADSWRAWVDGDPEKAIDKQLFRDMPEITDAGMEKVYLKYLQAAEMTSRFPGVKEVV